MLKRILNESSSMAVLGLLVNVAKYRPSLLSGALMPLLSSEDLYWLDLSRVQNSGLSFDAMSWRRSGEKIFEFAKEWALAPYRQQTFRQVVGSLIPKDKVLAAFVRSGVEKWEKPADRKAAIEFGILCAELDPANYRSSVNPEKPHIYVPRSPPVPPSLRQRLVEAGIRRYPVSRKPESSGDSMQCY